MTNTLEHRGPDDHGLVLFQNNRISKDHGIAGLGHRRLSIIDLSRAGHNPMTDKEKKLWVVFNGEIYNFQEIKNELEEKGYTFKSHSDTEVIIYAYQEWGEQCCSKFNGMFAFALYDLRKKCLFIARDRVGVKPLFYYHYKGEFVFASELKALMAYPGFSRDIDPLMLSKFLKFGYIPSPDCIFKNTYKLEPGHYLVMEHTGRIRKKQYWNFLEFYNKPSIRKNESEIMDELEGLLLSSFQYRMIADVPVGVFLSGGIDSTLVTAVLQKHSQQKIKTFTIGFHEFGSNEAEWAKKIARYLGTDHTELYCTKKDAIRLIEKLPFLYDEPFADSSGIPTHLVSRLARKKVKVVLSGDGGDELFCGYTRYFVAQKYRFLFRSLPYPARQILSVLLEYMPVNIIYSLFNSRYSNLKEKFKKMINVLRDIKGNSLDHVYESMITFWNNSEIEKIMNNKYDPSSVLFNKAFKKLKHKNMLEQMMAADFLTYLPDDIMTKVDRASMGISLEAREPLLDYRIAEYAARLPLQYKYSGESGKNILKKILYKYVPRELVDRPKQGFGIPVQLWLKNDLKKYINEYLNENRIRREGFFSYPVIKQNIDNFLADKTVNVSKVWSLLMFEMWYEKWIQ